MSDKQAAPGGEGTGSGGDQEKRDSVAYETHQKLLSEKKKAAERASALEQELEQFRTREKERENQELEKQKNYEQLLRNREDELKKATEQLKTVEVERLNARKLDAFFKTLGGTLEQKFWQLVDIDQIAIDPSTKTVDEMSVSKYVDDFRKTYPETIRKPGSVGMPSEAPRGNSGRLSYDEWKALPLKEKKARMGEVQLPK